MFITCICFLQCFFVFFSVMVYNLLIQVLVYVLEQDRQACYDAAGSVLNTKS